MEKEHTKISSPWLYLLVKILAIAPSLEESWMGVDNMHIHICLCIFKNYVVCGKLLWHSCHQSHIFMRLEPHYGKGMWHEMDLYVVNFTKLNITIPKKKLKKNIELWMNTDINLHNYAVDYREAILDLSCTWYVVNFENCLKSQFRKTYLSV